MIGINQWLSVHVDSVVRGQFSTFCGVYQHLFSCVGLQNVDCLTDAWSASLEVDYDHVVSVTVGLR